MEEVAFQAREDKRVDRRSGVSQRLPISTLENVLSSAEQRAVRSRDSAVVARVADVYAAIPSMTGKFELEYEGELRGAENIARELIRAAIGKTFTHYFTDANMQPVVQWFELGGELKVPANASSAEVLAQLKKIQGLFDNLSVLDVSQKDDARSSPARPNSFSKASGPTSASTAAKSAATLPMRARRPSPANRANPPAACRAANSINWNLPQVLSAHDFLAYK